MNHDVKCSMCGKPISVGNTTYHRNIKSNKPFYCQLCLSKLRSMNTKRRMDNMSEEEKKSSSNKRLDTISKKPQEERDATSKKISQSLRNRSESDISKWKDNIRDGLNNRSVVDKEATRIKRAMAYANKSEDELKVIGNKISDAKNAKSDKEKEEIIRKQKETKANRTQEQKDASLQKFRDTIANKSNEEKQTTKERMSEAQTRRWESLTSEEKNDKLIPLINAGKSYWENATEEDRKTHSDKISISWKNKPEEEKAKRNLAIANAWNNKSLIEHVQHGEKISASWSNKSEEERQAHGEKISAAWEHKPFMKHILHSEKISSTWANSSEEIRRNRVSRTYKSANKHDGHFTKTFEEEFKSSYDGEYAIQSEYKITSNGHFHRWDYAVFHNAELDMLIDLDGAYYHNDGEYEYDGIHGFSELGDARRGMFIPDGVKHSIIMEHDYVNTYSDMVSNLGKPYGSFIDDIFIGLRCQPFPYPVYSDMNLVRSFHNLRKENNGMNWDSQYGMHMVYHFHPSIWHNHIDGKMCPYDAYMDDGILMDMIKSHMVIHTRNRNKITQCFLLSDVAPRVPIFTPIMAMKVIQSYLSEYDTIVDANMGYGGTMLATIAMGKNYIGHDTDIAHVNEAGKMVSWFTSIGIQVNSHVIDHVPSGPCMCSYIQYGDDYIDGLIENSICERYVLVVPHTEKYKDYIVDEIPTSDHFGKRSWYVIKMQK